MRERTRRSLVLSSIILGQSGRYGSVRRYWVTTRTPFFHRDVWGGYDQTPLISTGKFYYLVFVSLGVKPNVWFKNLRLLQIQKELNLIQSIHISLEHFTHKGGEIVAKIKALEQVVGTDIMNWYRIPPRKKLKIMSTKICLNLDRAKALRIHGLAAREGRRE